MMPIVFLGLGIWCLIQAWRGTAFDLRPRLGFPRRGEPLRLSTRLIFGIGGILLAGLGLLTLPRMFPQ
jgi:hypothetical protein